MIIYEKLSDEKKVEFEMFAHYGFAVILSQKFEKAIAALLQGEFALANKGKLPVENYLEEVTKLYKGNLGGLLKKLRTHMTIPADKEELLQKALNRRNYLIHDYFYHNESKATVTDGRMSIIQELVADQVLFADAIIWVDSLCQEGLRKIGVSAEQFAETAERNRQYEVAKFRKGEPVEMLTK
ncbi:MAG: hypothetical protein ABL930_00405 [Pseudobdellovibrio sp.]